MTVIVDTSVVLALLVVDDAFHSAAERFYAALDEDVVTTPMAAAEMDHLVGRRAGDAGLGRLRADLESGAIQVRWWATAMPETLAIARARPPLGLADASLIALAPVARTTRIATFDRTRFSAARTTGGEPFTLLP